MTLKIPTIKPPRPLRPVPPHIQMWPNRPPGEKIMGLVYAEIELINGGDIYAYRKGRLPQEEIKRAKVKALVDTGAYMLAINEQVKLELDLPVIEEQIGTLADESRIKVEIVGPVEVRFGNRRCTVDAMVLPGNAEILLGAIPMEDLDVLVDPKQQKLIVNPEHPYIAQKHLK
jgi:clan AA aspartic protease